MVRANFSAYGAYVTDSLHQWDVNRTLQVTGLNLSVVPEVHFSNSNMRAAIVRQATLDGDVVRAEIPNSLLQQPLRIKAHIGIYEGRTFKVIERAEIPVIPRKRPEDYEIEDSDEEVYSFKRLENEVANMVTRAQFANVVANANKTEGNSELVDIRTAGDGVVYASAGEAVRAQATMLSEKIDRIRVENDIISKRNIIEVLQVEELSNTGTLSCELQPDGSLRFDGTTVETVSFLLHLDGATVPNHAGDFYIRWSEKIAMPAEWGLVLYFADGTASAAEYTATSHFIPISADYSGRKLVRIKLIFAAGWSFDGQEMRIYTDFYSGGSFAGYEPRYTPKSALKSTSLSGLKWCSLGDSLTANTGNTGEDWQKRVSESLGLEYSIAAVGGRTTGGFGLDEPYKSIPADVDIITVMGGTNDCSQALPLEAEGDEYYFNSGSYSGSIRKLIKMLQDDFPNAKIVFCNCLSVRLNEAGVAQEVPWKNAIGLTMSDYAIKCLSVCNYMGIPCINLCGESGINGLNATKYLVDALHPNALGYKKIADVYIHNFIKLFG